MSLEAKAGILAMFYGLEQLTAQSNKVGLGLQNFEKFTGLSADALQRWQYLMRQGGVSAEETAQNVVGLQKALAQMALNKGAPAGITALSNVVGGLDSKRLQDPFYFLEKIREYAQKVKAKGGGAPLEAVMNEILGSFHLSDNFIAQLKTSGVDLNAVKPSQIYSPKEEATLAKMSADWANLGNQIEKGIGRLNVSLGPSFLKDLSVLVPQVLALTKAFADLVKQLNVLSGISTVFKGWSLIFKQITEDVNEVKNSPAVSRIRNGTFWENVFSSKNLNTLKNNLSTSVTGNTAALSRAIGGVGPQSSNNLTVNTTVQVGEGADADTIGAAVSKHTAEQVNRALRQIPSPRY
jgi:hypothetical protein